MSIAGRYFTHKFVDRLVHLCVLGFKNWQKKSIAYKMQTLGLGVNQFFSGKELVFEFSGYEMQVFVSFGSENKNNLIFYKKN